MAYEKYTKVSAGAAIITLADMLEYMHVDESVDDNIIQALIDGWTLWVEEYCWSNFNETTWRLDMEEWQTKIEIRKNPLKAVTSITYRDASDVEQTLASTNYKVYKGIPAEIEILSMPTLYDRPDAISINFTAENTDDLPMVKTALMSLISLQYLQKEDFNPGSIYISMAKRILGPVRKNYF